MSFLDFTGLTHLVSKLLSIVDTKQDKLTGTDGYVVSFKNGGPYARPETGSTEGTAATDFHFVNQLGAWYSDDPTLIYVENGVFKFLANGKPAALTVADPTNTTNATTKQYVDDAVASAKRYTDDSTAGISFDNPVFTGSISMDRELETTIGKNSVALGQLCQATGQNSVAMGERCVASGNWASALGSQTQATANYAYAEGSATISSGMASHAEGRETVASGRYSHAEGLSTASGGAAHAENWATAEGDYSHAEGNGIAKPNAKYSHAEGEGRTSAAYAHAEGLGTYATGEASHGEGSSTEASGRYSHAEGRLTKAWYEAAHAEGKNAHAEGEATHSEGYYTHAKGKYIHTAGEYTVGYYQAETAVGRYNVDDAINGLDNGVKDLFVVGAGTADTARADAFRVSTTSIYGMHPYSTTGADYAEMFEWFDQNLLDEDRVGRFVTLDGDKIRIATPEDDYILGVVSANPSVIGDVFEDNWKGMWQRDLYGRMLFETHEPEPVTSADSGLTQDPEKVYGTLPVVSPDYDPNKPYVSRRNRKEWAPVGLLGKLIMIDDGTCTPNAYATCGSNGIAVASDSRTRYRVMKRIDDSHVQIMIL